MLIEVNFVVYLCLVYLGLFGWVGVDLVGEVDWVLVDDWIVCSWEFVVFVCLFEVGG